MRTRAPARWWSRPPPPPSAPRTRSCSGRPFPPPSSCRAGTAGRGPARRSRLGRSDQASWSNAPSSAAVERRGPEEPVPLVAGQEIGGRDAGRLRPVDLEQERLQVGRREPVAERAEDVFDAALAGDAVQDLVGHGDRPSALSNAETLRRPASSEDRAGGGGPPVPTCRVPQVRTPRRRRSLRTAAVLLGAALVLAACSSTAKNKPAVTTSTTTTTTAPPRPPRRLRRRCRPVRPTGWAWPARPCRVRPAPSCSASS